MDIINSKRFNYFLLNTKLVFLFFVFAVFFFYRSLFQSYFEGDEWFAFTLNFPLTDNPVTGFLKAMVQEGGDSPTLVQSQHIVPISRGVFFLNTFFFGTNFVPYAFISLLLHAINSFLVFILITLLLPRKLYFAFLGGLFFALSPVHMHVVTWAATYGTNSLPVTFSLASIIFFKLAYLRKNRKFIFISVAFLFLALAAKETSFILFILLPLMAFFEKKVFPVKLLVKIFAISLFVYLTLRFILPGIYSLPNLTIERSKPQDTKTVVSRDVSIHKNIISELAFRTITFPIRITGTTFLPRKTVFSIVQFVTPVLSPVEPGGNTIGQLAFLYGSGNFVVIYLAGIGIIIFCLVSIVKFIKAKLINDAQALVLGTATVTLSAMPLVIIVLSFPRWGYDFYFDSRYYYNSSVGAAIIFPFLIYSAAGFLTRNFRALKYSAAVFILFFIWFIQNTYIFNLSLPEFTGNYRPDRHEVVRQLKGYLPALPSKAVFYFETDGKSAYGAKLPFDTSVPQALTVIYYDKNPLPDNFFDKPLFSGNQEGYQEDDGRGFGYFTSREKLIQAVNSGSFSIDNIYGFYYYAKDVKLKNITLELRKEIREVSDLANEKK